LHVPIVVPCPTCNARLKAPDAAAGRTLICPGCRTPVVMPGPGPVVASPGGGQAQRPAAAKPAPPPPAPTPPAPAAPKEEDSSLLAPLGDDFKLVDEAPAPQKEPPKKEPPRPEPPKKDPPKKESARKEPPKKEPAEEEEEEIEDVLPADEDDMEEEEEALEVEEMEESDEVEAIEEAEEEEEVETLEVEDEEEEEAPAKKSGGRASKLGWSKLLRLKTIHVKVRESKYWGCTLRDGDKMRRVGEVAEARERVRKKTVYRLDIAEGNDGVVVGSVAQADPDEDTLEIRGPDDKAIGSFVPVAWAEQSEKPIWIFDKADKKALKFVLDPEEGRCSMQRPDGKEVGEVLTVGAHEGKSKVGWFQRDKDFYLTFKPALADSPEEKLLCLAAALGMDLLFVTEEEED
jgi:hypothetical protein